MKKIVTLHDGSALEVGLTGNSSAKVIMLPGARKNVYGDEAESLAKWGVDPEAGKKLVEGLSDKFRVLYFDYEGHLFEHPRPDQLTADSVVTDFLWIADEMKVESFSYYGYSWLALAGLQLAVRSSRLESLIMGGYPPFEGPYREMLTVTRKAYDQTLNTHAHSENRLDAGTSPEEIDWETVQVSTNSAQTKQFVTLYQSLTDFDDRKVQHLLTFPKLTFAGEKDTIVYGENFGGVTVDIAGLLQKYKANLLSWGWNVEILQGSGMDHTKAMQPTEVLPLIKPWLIDKLL
ncbi:alpha/beta fold hydrolase [Paenibacillus terreus]|uniref:Alpha/beta fold hydrolase n=1 Tax=Paenibacillus terreus TaxID=1387834 RepID=A0ABV5B4Y0_9BACL